MKGPDRCRDYPVPRIGHEELNKDRPGTKDGQKPYDARLTRFQKVYELATQETEAWRGLVRSEICRLQGKTRGAALLTMTAGVETKCEK